MSWFQSILPLVIALLSQVAPAQAPERRPSYISAPPTTTSINITTTGPTTISTSSGPATHYTTSQAERNPSIVELQHNGSAIDPTTTTSTPSRTHASATPVATGITKDNAAKSSDNTLNQEKDKKPKPRGATGGRGQNKAGNGAGVWARRLRHGKFEKLE